MNLELGIISMNQMLSIIFIGILEAYACNGAIVTLSIGHQGLIRVGETVRFECVHTGLEAITWIINEYYYTSTNLPEKHSLDNNNNGVLIITDVDLMMNGSSYQCFVQSTFSNIVHLYVESAERSYSSSSPVMTAMPTNLLTINTHSGTLKANEVLMTSIADQRPKSINDNTPTKNHSLTGTIVTLSVLIPGSFILGLGLATIVFLLILLHIRRKLKNLYTQQSSQMGMPYSTIAFIKTKRNEAYDNVSVGRIPSSSLNNNISSSSQNPVYEQIS